MADPAPKRKRMPVGCGFRPTEQELIAHYLHHRLKADDPSIYTTIPEIDVCKYEPPDLLALAASAISLTEFDDSECYFFAPRDYKYSNSTRSNRATSRGFWKVTGRDRKIKDRDTNKVIGIQRILVFYEGRFPRGIKTSWVIHEYHDATFSLNQRTHVVCKLMKKYDKKTRKKISTDLKIQTPSQSNETTEFIIQTPSQSNEIIATIQTPSQSNEITDLIHISSQLNEYTDMMIQTPFQSNEVTDLMIQTPFQSNESTGLMIEIPFQLNEASNSIIQTPSWSSEISDLMIGASSHSNEVTDFIMQTPFQSNEAADKMIQISPELNSIIEASNDLEELIASVSKYMYELSPRVVIGNDCNT